MKKPYINLIIIILIFVLAAIVSLPQEKGISIGSFKRSGNLSLGLDLQGGMQVLLEADVENGASVSADQLETARQILENRSNGLGVSEVVFQVAGGNRIVAEFPGMTNTDEVLATLKGTGLLEFVDTGTESMQEGTAIKTDHQKAVDGPATETVAETAIPENADAADKPKEEEKVYHTVLTGSDLKTAAVQMYNNVPVVSFEMSSQAKQIFADYTANNINKFLTIVLDGKVISSPRINSAIPDGSGVIEGNFTIDSANALAVQLRYGALPVPLKIVEYKMIGATLGEDSLKKSMIAGIIGLAIACLFMLIYYRLPGLVAVLSILFYGVVTVALYKLIPVTLSLSGIAGLLLTTGSAFDANILIFERVKEELRSGKSVQQAVGLCWSRAWSSIRDSNIATLITSIILFYFGSSFGATIVKGFAVTLSLGVVISVFSAYLVTQTLLSLFTEKVSEKDKQKFFGVKE